MQSTVDRILSLIDTALLDNGNAMLANAPRKSQLLPGVELCDDPRCEDCAFARLGGAK